MSTQMDLRIGPVVNDFKSQLAKLLGCKAEQIKVDLAIDLVSETDVNNVSVGQITAICCDVYGCTPEQFAAGAEDKHQEAADARHAARYLIKQHYPLMSLKQIGRLTGTGDHSTVLHSLKAVDNSASYKNEFMLRLDIVKTRISNINKKEHEQK